MLHVCDLGSYVYRSFVVCVFIFIACNDVPERYYLRTVSPQNSYEYFERFDFNTLDLSALQELGWLYIQNNRMRSAIPVYEILIKEDPNNSDYHYYLGVALSKEHQKNEAVRSFSRAITISPGLAEAYFAKALLLNERGDGFDSAIQVIQEGLLIDPESAYGYFVKGFILCSRGENAEAEISLKKATELDGSAANAHYYLALIYLRREDDQKAIQAMEKTIDSDPYYTEAYYSLGTLYARSGRLSDGEKMIDIFQDLSVSDMDEDHYLRMLYRSNNPVSVEQRVAAHYNLGLVYLGRDNWADAELHFRLAYELDETYAEAVHNLGVVSSRNGLHDKAIEYYDLAISLQPTYALAYKNLGLSRLSQGLYEQAEYALRRAISLDSSLTTAVVDGLSTALIQQGKVQEGLNVKSWHDKEKQKKNSYE